MAFSSPTIAFSNRGKSSTDRDSKSDMLAPLLTDVQIALGRDADIGLTETLTHYFELHALFPRSERVSSSGNAKRWAVITTIVRQLAGGRLGRWWPHPNGTLDLRMVRST